MSNDVAASMGQDFSNTPGAKHRGFLRHGEFVDCHQPARGNPVMTGVAHPVAQIATASLPHISARVLYAIPGIWTDSWFDAPDAWWAWVCAFAGWSMDDWHRFRSRWTTAGSDARRLLSIETGITFFDWRRLPGGSTFASVDRAVATVAADLRHMNPGTSVTLIGHSKGGSVIKHLLIAAHRATESDLPVPWDGGATLRHGICIDAPLDLIREAGSIMFGIRPRIWPASRPGVPVACATINNWYDPSGGRLAGVPNYQVRTWNDNFHPWPPHGMKSGLARRVLGDLGAVPSLVVTNADTVSPSSSVSG